MKKRIALVAVLILFILCLGFSALAATATDVFPDSLPEKKALDLDPIAAEDVYETAGAAVIPESYQHPQGRIIMAEEEQSLDTAA